MKKSASPPPPLPPVTVKIFKYAPAEGNRIWKVCKRTCLEIFGNVTRCKARMVT